jgi:hypothetical protein
MRRKSTKKDLPSTHDVSVYIHNEFVKWLEDLKGKILVSCVRLNVPCHLPTPYQRQATPGRISCTANCWTADNTKGSYLGVTAHWIEVVGKKWELRTNVIGFRAISGEHSGWNLGRYLIGACDRVGICSKNGSKVSPIMGILLISIIDNG